MLPRRGHLLNRLSSPERAARLLLAPAAALLVMRVVEAHRVLGGYDTFIYREGARAFFHHGNPYVNKTFVTPPSGLLVLAPLKFVAFNAAYWGMQIVTVVALVAAAYLLVQRLLDVDRETAIVAAMVVVAATAPTYTSIGFGSLNGLILLSFALAIVASSDGSERAAGLWMGVGLALKPVLAPVWLALVIQRRWKASAWSFVPVVAGSAVAVAVDPKARHFLDQGLPNIIHGLNDQFRRFDISLSAFMRTSHLPHGLTPVARAGALAVTLAVAYLLWRRHDRATTDAFVLTSQWIEIGSVLLLGTLLASQFSWRYYAVFLLPLFVLAVRPVGVARNALVWLGSILLLAPDNLGIAADNGLPRGLAVGRQTVALALVLVGLGAGALRATEARRSAN